MVRTNVAGTAVKAPAIELYGLFGEFWVNGSPFVIRYASTFANPAKSGHRELLRELKPVRDRLRVSDLRDLESLLQRDLNDARVAQELIPYLQGERSPIGFFPAILAVLVPRGYLSQTDQEPPPYPKPQDHGSGKTAFGDCWLVEQYEIGSTPLPMGRLSISPADTEVIVLDGQHRANAFRFLSGDFDPRNNIYQAFYDGLPQPKPLSVDLPVTLIWFESRDGTPIRPKLISRQLFVDVNNSARAVSMARTILLDDRSVTAVGTQVVLNDAAAYGFTPNRFSLLHSAFDMDSDLAAGRVSSLALTTPEILEEALRWSWFGSTTYDELSTWEVGRMKVQKNLARFARIFGDNTGLRLGEGYDNGPILFQDSENTRNYREKFQTVYLPILRGFFTETGLFSHHYIAGQTTEDWVNESGDTTTQEVWSRVFKGGEGLYWSFAVVEDRPRATAYRKAIAGIENRFLDERAAKLGLSRAETKQIFDSMVSKAFQSGFVMAVDYLARRDGNFIAAAEKLIDALNSYSVKNFAAIFTALRPLIIGDTTPRSWPAYRNLLVRLYDRDKGEFVNRDQPETLLEWRALESDLTGTAYALDVTDLPDEKGIVTLTKKRRASVAEVLGRCGIDTEWIESPKALARGKALLSAIVAERQMESA